MASSKNWLPADNHKGNEWGKKSGRLCLRIRCTAVRGGRNGAPGSLLRAATAMAVRA